MRRPSSLFEPRHPTQLVVKIVFVVGRKNFEKKRGALGTTRRWHPVRVLHDVRLILPVSSRAFQPENGLLHSRWILGVEDSIVIDPSAGSPTETLLRLLLPLSDKVH